MALDVVITESLVVLSLSGEASRYPVVIRTMLSSQGMFTSVKVQ